MAVPKHKLAIEHQGRPLKFKTVKELESKIDEYFAWCDARVKEFFDTKTNATVVYNSPAPYTMSGLAFYLDIDRRTLVNYSHKDQFFPTIARARAKVEQDHETRLLESRTPQGAMFALKNNSGWIEESKTTLDAEINSKTELTPEALAVLAKASRSNDGFTEPE
jgi:hypothetical protein